MFPLCYLLCCSCRSRRACCSRCAGRARGREGGGRKVDHFNGDERGCAAVAARAADAAAGNNNTFIHPDSSLVSGMAARYQDMRPPHQNVPAPLQFPAQTRISPLLTQTINIHRPVVFHLTSPAARAAIGGAGCKPSYYRQRASRACDDLTVTHLLLVTRKRVSCLPPRGKAFTPRSLSLTRRSLTFVRDDAEGKRSFGMT